MHRGGCALFIKNHFRNRIAKIETASTDCIFFKLKALPHVTFMGCYIPPTDSPYHSLEPLSELTERLHSSNDESFIVMGDMNARFGNERDAFITGKHFSSSVEYVPSADPISSPNMNARCVTSMLAPHLILLNGLKFSNMTFPSALTFRQKKKWISELDSFLVSPECLPIIHQMKIHQRLDLPSDHAPISCIISFRDAVRTFEWNLESLAERAADLGAEPEEPQPRQVNGLSYRRPIKMTQVSEVRAQAALQEATFPPLLPQNLDETAQALNDLMYNIVADSQERDGQVHENDPTHTPVNNRWRQLIEDDDQRAIWKAISWNGSMASSYTEDVPSDEAFRDHFENLLNPHSESNLHQDTDAASIYLPATDDPIQPEEVFRASKSMKVNKSGGVSGIPPGFLKLLPPRWFTFLASFFSLVFFQGAYPFVWSVTKLMVLFKKGSRKMCDNYRGISIMDSIAKLYDSILNRRLELWFKPDREQAGSQKGRGCVEHLLTLRLLMDFAKHRKKKLFVVYVDFSKAYDRVPRHLLLQRMIALGCGATMVKAIAAVYHSTKMMLRKAMITTSIGVRQGSPTSCFLFTLLVNDLIKNLKDQCSADGYLGWLHVLMLMDDTAILASSRERALEKVKILSDFCAESGMVINQSKTKFMVINGDEDDRDTLKVEGMEIQNCDSYVYLGCVYTQDGRTNSAVVAQCKSKWSHVA